MVIAHILKLIYLLFKPTFMSKYKYFSDQIPSKGSLIMYYVLAISVGYYVILYKINT